MLGRTYDSENCSAARALEIIGERWSLLIIRNALFADAVRFSDFARSLDIAPNILSRRLAQFVEDGLMETKPGSRSYHLTPKGRDLAKVVVALTEWGDRWLSPEGPPVVYRHAGCGGRVVSSVTCEECGAVGSEMGSPVATPGPGAHSAQRERLNARAARHLPT